MKEIGQILREAREKNGLSLEQVSQQTRIRLTYLKAIEEGDFSKVPGTVYVKGFLKSFATVVEVDCTEIMELYTQNEQMQPIEAVQEIREVRLTKSQRTIPVGKIIMACMIIGALVVGGVFVSRFWSILKNETIPQLREPEQTDQATNPGSQDGTATHESTGTGTGTQPVAENTQVADDETQATTEPGQTDSQTVPAVAPVAQQPTPEPTSDSEDSTLVQPVTAATKIQVIAIQTAWVRVTVDDKVVFADLIHEGETKTYEGETIHLRIGNAAGIQVNYDGKILGPFGETGKIAERVFGE